jgi:ribonuclease R
MPRPLPSRADIVHCLVQARRGLHAREIASRCRIPEGAYRHLLELLDQLSIDGSIVRLPGTRFKARPRPLREREGWDGVLSMNPRGFGFVTAAGHEDVYVAPDSVEGALHGDRVRVAVLAHSARGLEGRIDRIVERRNPRVAGVLRKRGRSAWLEPDDTRVRGPIVLVPRLVDGHDGDAAVASITRFPELGDETPEGELVAVLGVPGDPNAEVAKILVREQIVEAHPDAAVREAEALAARLGPLGLAGRVNLRGVPLPTIDPEDARDHDDAVWVQRHGEGYQLWVAIADVSEYVRAGSELDREALARGCTLYLPDRAVPMLPAALTTDLCSLLPDRDRLCLCLLAEFDKQGRVRSYDLVEGVMRSSAMLTYGGVARALGFTDAPPRSAQADALKRDLKVIDELARRLRQSRLRRGAMDLDLPEARVLLDEQTGRPIDVIRRAGDSGVKRAYQMVEELMLIANELVARWLSRRRCPTVYRVHGKPDEDKLEQFGQAARTLGAAFELEQMLEPAGVARWLKSIREHPRRPVLEMLLLRSMKQASYDIANIGHFGLASDAYLHFTSPIRRYPDIQVHRAIKHLLRGGQPDTSPPAVEALRASATAASVRERASMDVEREVVDLYRSLLMRDQLEEAFEGSVTGICGAGLFVTLDHPFVDVLVRFESLGLDHYEATEDELGVVGLGSGDRIRLGDRVAVQIEDVAVLRRTVYARRIPPDDVFDQSERRPPRRGRARSKAKQTESEHRRTGRRRGKAAPRRGRTRHRG